MAPATIQVTINGKTMNVTGAAADIVVLAVESMAFINSPRVSGQVIIDFGKDGAKARAFASTKNLPATE
jgi:5,10-methylene-tetrahydrofolate dehydrogenase/methenyl tetrahydrofolate cyclohydrolase